MSWRDDQQLRALAAHVGDLVLLPEPTSDITSHSQLQLQFQDLQQPLLASMYVPTHVTYTHKMHLLKNNTPVYKQTKVPTLVDREYMTNDRYIERNNVECVERHCVMDKRRRRRVRNGAGGGKLLSIARKRFIY